MNLSGCNAAEYLLAGKPREQIALYGLERSCSYGELADAAAAVSSYLLQRSGGAADRVILAGENSFFWVGACLGILRAGLVCVPLPAAASAEEAAYILHSSGARFAIVDGVFARKHAGLFAACHLLINQDLPPIPGVLSQGSAADLPASLPDGLPAAAVHGDSLAALMFTSGSTGKPRGVRISHANIAANTESIIEYLGLHAGDRMMCVLPFHYCFGASLLHTHLRVGGSLVLENRFVYPEVVLQRMLDLRCTGFAGVPSHFQILLHRSSLRQRRFPHLRMVQQAGGHLPPAMVRELVEALPGTRVYIMYGQTEATARLSYLPPQFLETKLGSIGKGIPGVRLTVVNEAGAPVNVGEVGEIVAEGANIAGGYWQAPEESALNFRDGKLYTGDLASVDADGFIYIVGRAKDFLKCGGNRVSSSQIEDRILACEGVLETSVVPIADEILGDAVGLFVVPRNPDRAAFAEHVLAFCRRHLTHSLVPRQIVVLRALPKNSAGKVLKHRLREFAGQCPLAPPGGSASPDSTAHAS